MPRRCPSCGRRPGVAVVAPAPLVVHVLGRVGQQRDPAEGADQVELVVDRPPAQLGGERRRAGAPSRRRVDRPRWRTRSTSSNAGSPACSRTTSPSSRPSRRMSSPTATSLPDPSGAAVCSEDGWTAIRAITVRAGHPACPANRRSGGRRGGDRRRGVGRRGGGGGGHRGRGRGRRSCSSATWWSASWWSPPPWSSWWPPAWPRCARRGSVAAASTAARFGDLARQQRQVLQRLAALALHDVAELRTDRRADAVVGLQDLHLVVEVAVHRVDLAQLVAQLGELVVLGEPGARRKPGTGSSNSGRDDQGPDPNRQPRRATLRGDPVAPVRQRSRRARASATRARRVRRPPGPGSGDGGGRSGRPGRAAASRRRTRPARPAVRVAIFSSDGRQAVEIAAGPSSTFDILAAATGPGAARRR